MGQVPYPDPTTPTAERDNPSPLENVAARKPARPRFQRHLVPVRVAVEAVNDRP